MKLKEPKGYITGKQYDKWLNSLPPRVFTYWMISSFRVPVGTWIFEIEKEYPEYFE